MMLGAVLGIHVLAAKTWIAGTSPAMTETQSPNSFLIFSLCSPSAGIGP